VNELRRVRIVGFIEACSAIALFFVAMPLKYLADMPKAVTYVGGLHGFLWLAYILIVIAAYAVGKLPVKWVGYLGLASIIPFGPFLVDGKLKRMETQPASVGA
jgi:integral membrane protein